MERQINDEDILAFLRRNWAAYPSQITLIGTAIRELWPGGPPTRGSERVVRLCLQENQARASIGV